MEALSQDCRRGCPWELLYADYLVIIDESSDGLLNQFIAWKDSFDAKGFRVNMSKTEILVSNSISEHPLDPSKYPCSVSKKGVSNKSIFCHHFKSWIHHRCSNIKGRLRPDPNFKCHKCCQEREITPVPQLKHVDIGNDKLEVVRLFCYLGDVTSESGACCSATTSRKKSMVNPYSLQLKFFPS